jgi:alpha-tubulin suppressor-like RCC1 family protein
MASLAPAGPFGDLGPASAAGAGDPTVVEVARGQSHSCELMSNGTVRCFGDNAYGQTGAAAIGLTAVPTEVAGLIDVVGISAGYYHSCAVLADGSARCWGYNGSGQLGSATPGGPAPATVTGLSGVVDISAGSSSTCAATSSGSVSCWGDNFYDQLGNPAIGETGTSTPTAVPGLTGVAAVGVGSVHACALLSAGTVSCWGDEIVNGQASSAVSPTAVAGVTGATAIAVGANHNCVIGAGDTVSCWGYNSFGGLGVDPGTTPSAAAPQTTVHAGVESIAVDFSGSSTCIVLDDGAIECWGYNLDGQLGNGTTTSSHVATLVSGVSDAASISLGGSAGCAVRTGGAVVCWGSNENGRIGAPVAGSASLPQEVVSLGDIVSIDVGVNHGCAVVESAVPANDGVWCWGDNTYGQLGDGTTSPTPTSVPVAVSGVDDALSVEVGHFSSCAVLDGDGTVWCWGRDNKGQLGNGAPGDSAVPAQVVGLLGVTDLGVGTENACALLADATVTCWGSASAVGTGDGLTHQTSPIAVPALSGIRSVDVGGYNGCAVSTTDVAWCWGSNNSGQLGTGVTSPGTTITPQAVVVASPVATMATSGAHTCAIETDGDLRCWGSNIFGQIGNGSTGSSVAAGATVAGIDTPLQVGVGTFHTCVLDTQSDVECWGHNDDGNLGDGTQSSSSSPVPTVGLAPATSIAVGGLSTCAVVSGEGRCWGANDKGQLGNGGIDRSLVPIERRAMVVPGIPSGVGLSPSSGRLTVTFAPPTPVAGAAVVDYVVQRRTVGATTWTTVADGVSTATSVALTGLTNGQAYQVRVAARSAGYTGSFTTALTATPFLPPPTATAPSAPRALVAKPANASVALTWTAPASTGGAAITDYVVQFRQTGSSTWRTFADGVRTTRTAVVTRLVNGRGYQFRVSAKNSAGTGAASGTATATPRTVPGVPRTVAVSTARGALVVSWRAPSSDGGSAITDYRIQRRVAGAKKWKTVKDGVATTTSVRLTDLPAGSDQEFRVRAVSSVGAGAWSGIVEGSVPR